MNKSVRLVLALLGCSALVSACSSSSSGAGGAGAGGGGDGSGTCSPFSTGNAACSPCAQASCGSQLSAAQSDCADFFACVQACGCGSSCTLGCFPKAQAGSCAASYMSVGTCVKSSCASECSAAGGAGGGAGGGAAGASGDANPNKVSCSVPNKPFPNGTANGPYCWLFPIFGQSVMDVQMQCMQSYGGMPVSACPTEGLDGCCTTLAGDPENEKCWYMGDAMTEQAACGSGWQTTP